MRCTFLFIAILLIVSCGRHSSKTNDPVVFAQADDPELEQARIEAINSLDYFIKSFSDHRSDSIFNFSVKADFVDNGQHEFMWIDLKKIENELFIGYLGNEPQIIKNVKYGELISIEKSQIEDWIIVDSGTNTWEGGFSVKVLMKRK